MPTLYYIRHGQTDWNAELRFQGQKDIPLNDHGRQQAARNGQALALALADTGLVPEQLLFVASPLARTRETMEIVRRSLGLEPKSYGVDARLIEASYGELEGTTLAEFKAADPVAHKLRKRTRWTFQPPAGESHAMAHARILPWLAELERDVIVAGHGVIGRVLRKELLGLEPHAAADYVFPQDRIHVWDGVDERLV